MAVVYALLQLLAGVLVPSSVEQERRTILIFGCIVMNDDALTSDGRTRRHGHWRCLAMPTQLLAKAFDRLEQHFESCNRVGWALGYLCSPSSGYRLPCLSFAEVFGALG